MAATAHRLSEDPGYAAILPATWSRARSLPEVIRETEHAGFSILALRNLRRDYARPCLEWVVNRKSNHDRRVALAGEQISRIWLLCLAAVACSFDSSGYGL